MNTDNLSKIRTVIGEVANEQREKGNSKTANLIASAPDMLEALNKIYELPLEGGIVGDLRGNYDYNAEMKEWSIKVRRIAKEQITKAEGNEKNK